MKELMDEMMIYRSIKRISHEIIEKNKGVDDLVIIGIKTRGVALAKRLHDNIEIIEGKRVPYLTLDVKPWRDDNVTSVPIADLNYDLNNKIVVLCDDVLHTGRTARAAMDGIMHYGRAKMIELAVLIDRGHRELPIKADFVGKNIPTGGPRHSDHSLGIDQSGRTGNPCRIFRFRNQAV